MTEPMSAFEANGIFFFVSGAAFATGLALQYELGGVWWIMTMLAACGALNGDFS
jgi:hypothetical protein